MYTHQQQTNNNLSYLAIFFYDFSRQFLTIHDKKNVCKTRNENFR